MIWSERQLTDRIEAESKKRGLSLSQLQLLLAQERFLARIAASPERDNFIWKGGSLILRLYAHRMPKPRFTVDVDLLVRGFSIGDVTEYFERIIEMDLEDGFLFFNVRKTPLIRETPYGGERYSIDWRFFKKPQSHVLRVDVCAGDDVTEQKITTKKAFFLSDPSELVLNIYPKEFIFSEKLETCCRFGTGNTRLKDFIDMWGLIRMGMDVSCVKVAIKRCFGRRKVSAEPGKWQAILNDKEFAEIMEEQRKRRYVELGIPPVQKLFGEISGYLLKLYS